MNEVNYIFEWSFLGWLLPLPIIIWLAQSYLVTFRNRNKNNDEKKSITIHFPNLEMAKSAFGESSKLVNQTLKILSLYRVFLWLLWACLVVALMRPQAVENIVQVENEGYDLMLAVDLSGSMRALDFSTKKRRINRLEVTKVVVGKFVADRQGDRVGLVLFGDNAYLHVPLTLDVNSVSEMLNNAMIGMAGDATAIGDAIGLSVKYLKDRKESSRVIILLTDGENTAGTIPPREATQLAKEFGIRIYTVGVGSNGAVPVPTRSGHIVTAHMRLDEDLLRHIARETDGAYFQARNKLALEKIYEKINELETSQAETQEVLIPTPLFVYPLWLAMTILAGLIGWAVSGSFRQVSKSLFEKRRGE